MIAETTRETTRRTELVLASMADIGLEGATS